MKIPADNLHLRYSQNTTINTRVIENLVGQSSITEGDLVFDIGAGSGNISKVLLKKGARVTAIEKDNDEYLKCQKRFTGQDRFELYLYDFLLYDLPKDKKYKVFANLPFFHTADIINKILFCQNPPDDAYLIVQKEAAEKYAGIPKDTLASLLIKPLFWTNVIYHFDRSDFFPVPAVDVVLLQIEKRRCLLVPQCDYKLYKDFVITIWGRTGSTIKQILKSLFSYNQEKQLAKLLNIDLNTKSSNLTFHQLLSLFQYYLKYGSGKNDLITGISQQWQQHQSSRVKIHRTRNKYRSNVTY